jgi:hypothetical protein
MRGPEIRYLMGQNTAINRSTDNDHGNRAIKGPTNRNSKFFGRVAQVKRETCALTENMILLFSIQSNRERIFIVRFFFSGN